MICSKPTKHRVTNLLTSSEAENITTLNRILYASRWSSRGRTSESLHGANGCNEREVQLEDKEYEELVIAKDLADHFSKLIRATISGRANSAIWNTSERLSNNFGRDWKGIDELKSEQKSWWEWFELLHGLLNHTYHIESLL